MNTSFVLPKKKNLFKKDAEDAAAVYEEFVKDFGGPAKGTNFVRGGTIQPGQRVSAAREGPRSGEVYVPPCQPSSSMRAAFADDKDAAEDEPPPTKQAKGGKVKRIDLFLENMKRQQQERELRKELNLPPAEDDWTEQVGREAPDPGSTNLYLGNVAPDVDEQGLLREFGRFGPIGSVKIMWPRDEEQRRRGRNTGFVLFMERDDAARAKEAMDGLLLHGMVLNIGWGKGMPLPAVPIWPPPGGLADEAAAPQYPAPPAPGPDGRWHWEEAVPLAPQPQQGNLGAADVLHGSGTEVRVVVPADERTRFIIDAVAFNVLRDGCAFEQCVMEREADNPEFAFFFDTACPEHAYYRWRIFSLASGDSLRSWRAVPFMMVENSNVWVPPPMTGTSGVPAAARQLAQTGSGPSRRRGDESRPLTDAQRLRFETTLRRLTMSRADICSAMVQTIELSDSFAEVSEILADSLTLLETPPVLKVSRLFLLSDVLHNSAAPVRGASRFRGALQALLPDVFAGLRDAHDGASSRMGQELLRRHALRVLRAWRGWSVFPDEFLHGLQATLLAPLPDASTGAAGIDPGLAGETAALADAELAARCAAAGVPAAGSRADRLARLQAARDYGRRGPGPSDGDATRPQPDAGPVNPQPPAQPLGQWTAV